MKKPHVSNNSGNNEWYTPPEFILAAKKVLGTIDLDPASSVIANKIVKATTFYTIDDNGLEKDWYGNVWMNPPYASGLIKKFIYKLTEEIQLKNVKQCIVLVNNATETEWFQQLLKSSNGIVLLKKRVKFIAKDLITKSYPLQGQALLYNGKNTEKFFEVFSEFGSCLLPASK